MRTIRASELGSYLYCKRAWWYQRQGIESQNQAELQTGGAFHERHGARLRASNLMRLAGWAALMAGLVLLVIALTLQWIS